MHYVQDSECRKVLNIIQYQTKESHERHKTPSSIEVSKHYNNNVHTFSKHGKFVIVEQLRNINTTPIETLKLRLRERKDFWIKKLKTLTSYGLSQELH